MSSGDAGITSLAGRLAAAGAAGAFGRAAGAGSHGRAAGDGPCASANCAIKNKPIASFISGLRRTYFTRNQQIYVPSLSRRKQAMEVKTARSEIYWDSFNKIHVSHIGEILPLI
jgi:hypothetical protein